MDNLPLFSLSSVINNVLLLRQEKRDKERAGKPFRIWASDLGGCYRKLKLRQLGYSKIPYGIDSLNSFERGNTIHEWIQSLLKCDDIKELYPDIEVIDEGWVSDTDTVRRVDLILKIGQEKHLIEIKTSDKNQIKYIQNQNIWQEKRKDVLQLLDYYFALTKGGDTISTARLFYISEDLSWKLECGISPDRYKAEWETEVNNVKKVVLEDIVPPAQWCWTCYNKKSGKAYCQYIEHCFEALNIKWENDKKVNVQERKDGQNGSNSNQNISKRR